jgi:beta-xylosidase
MSRIPVKYAIPLLITLFGMACYEIPLVYEILSNKNPDSEFLYMGDPYILSYDSKYYLYGTSSNNGFQVYESTDLIDWEGPVGNSSGYALRKEDVWGDQWFWAPEVYYYNNQFYMFFSVEEYIAVATSDSPKGPFIQSEKSPLISSHNAIDPHLFIDDDGKKYLYYVVFNSNNEIWTAELNDDLLSIKSGTEIKCFSAYQTWEKSTSPPVSSVNEGPFVLKHNGYYYLTYSANHYASNDYGVGFAVSTSPSGPWTKYSQNPILQRPEDLTGTGHHSIFTDEKDDFFIVYHSHYDSVFVSPRKVHINRLQFSEKSDYHILEIDSIVSSPLTR